MPTLLGTIQLGPSITLYEDFEVDDSFADVLTVNAVVSPMAMSNSRVEDRFYDLQGLDGQLVPVIFSDKAFVSGYYTVQSADIAHWSYAGFGGPRTVVETVKLTLARVGTESQVDVESRLSGAQTRTNGYSIVGERWHVPPPGHLAYYCSTGSPSTLSLASADGTLTMYRGLATGVSPRWACPLAAWGVGRARLLDGNGNERTGVRAPLPNTGWEINNGLVRLRVDSGGLKVAAWDGTAYEEKTYNITIAGPGTLGAPTATTILRNGPQRVTVRCLWSSSPGRTVVDLTVRRGSRMVEGYIQTQPSAATIAVSQAASEATTSATGYIVASGNDAAGNRYMIGSAGSFTPNTGARSITKSSATTMDFVLGSIIGAGASGDAAVDWMKRYIGATDERLVGVRR
jgi:hypothetical protein